MNLQSLMLTDEKRESFCAECNQPCKGDGCTMTERAAIANAVVKLENHGISFYLPKKAKGRWDALLAEARKVVGE